MAQKACAVMAKRSLSPLYPNNVGALRRRAGLRQQDIAAALGMTQGAIGKIERGEVRLYATMAQRLAPVLKCHVWELLAQDQPDEVQRSLLDLLDKLPLDKQQTLLTLGRALAEEPQRYETPARQLPPRRRRA
jgi:transcriptional regulator with XRE-family HTH domain